MPANGGARRRRKGTVVGQRTRGTRVTFWVSGRTRGHVGRGRLRVAREGFTAVSAGKLPADCRFWEQPPDASNGSRLLTVGVRSCAQAVPFYTAPEGSAWFYKRKLQRAGPAASIPDRSACRVALLLSVTSTANDTSAWPNDKQILPPRSKQGRAPTPLSKSAPTPLQVCHETLRRPPSPSPACSVSSFSRSHSPTVHTDTPISVYNLA